MSNRLKNESSPYLLQHAENPVNWYPLCKEAFLKAEKEDKPIFLSIGYSTCHWRHVMAHESFEDDETAQILNRYFVSIKVDKEERPDIDSVYMSICQKMTGSGGWPTSIFMTYEQKPFFAGTYFPKTSRYGMAGFKDLLLSINTAWERDRKNLLCTCDKIMDAIKPESEIYRENADPELIVQAAKQYKHSYDKKYGGFGNAPKFPAAHNLLFLMKYYEITKDTECLKMVENTLIQMYRGGLFDHIGGGFSRYSTDRLFLVPHFEKMLYDNALLILAYCRAYEITKKTIYLNVAKKTAKYVLREMTSPEGGFYSAQDADSDGEEGKYYVFVPEELTKLLGEDIGQKFNKHYGITEKGNFEGKSIPNLLYSHTENEDFIQCLDKVYEYRRKRAHLHQDDKILVSWNALMIAALCSLYRVSRKEEYLIAAKKAQRFIEEKCCKNGVLYASYRDGTYGQKAFLDDHASYIFALISLYNTEFDEAFLKRAYALLTDTLDDFYDAEKGGFYLYGQDHETLILRPKESYDGAIPSGNSMMVYVLQQMIKLFPEKRLEDAFYRQLEYMYDQAKPYPMGYAVYLMALSDHAYPPPYITVVLKDTDDIHELPFLLPQNAIIKVLKAPTVEYSLKNDRLTFYVCRNHACLPPVNIEELKNVL